MPATRASNRSLVSANAIAIPATYPDLLRAVRAELFTGRVKIEYAWLMMFHNIGHLIHEHVLLFKERATYAAKTFERLAADTDVSKRVLYEWVQFYRCFPIVRQSAQLTRTHYRLLCQVGDDKQRKLLAAQAISKKWTSTELIDRVRALNATLALKSADGTSESKAAVQLLAPKRGRPGLYRVVARGDSLAVDVGFKLYLPLSATAARRLKSGDIVTLENGDIAIFPDATDADLFTYRATLRRVVDGDTLTITLVLPHYAMDEKLRLRGLDCPEMDTPEGKAAKRFVERLMTDTDEITVVTSKVDKYDRYLADVYLKRRSTPAFSGASAAEGEIFLNNALLENGHAVRMEASSQPEWMP